MFASSFPPFFTDLFSFVSKLREEIKAESNQVYGLDGISVGSLASFNKKNNPHRTKPELEPTIRNKQFQIFFYVGQY